MAMITAEPTMTQRMGTSRSMRLVEAAPSVRTSFNPARKAEMMVGIVRRSVIKPAAATAPAPMGRM